MQELGAARHSIKALEDDRVVMKAMCDKSMDKVVRAGRILLRRSGVVVPEDIVADVLVAPAGVSKHSSSATPVGEASCCNTLKIYQLKTSQFELLICNSTKKYLRFQITNSVIETN
jgi:hypothetical protein